LSFSGGKYLERDKKPYIKLEDINVEKNRLTCYFDFSPDLEKFFNAKLFYAEYCGDLKNVDESILSIPPLVTVITIAWATGADIHLKKLDKNFSDSLEKIRPIFEKWYPQFSFSGKIKANNIVLNESHFKGDKSDISPKYGLFFSGGIDSLSSFIIHKDKKPTLISIWGADIPTTELDFWKRIKNIIKNFAKEKGVKNHFIKTNGREMINDHNIANEYGIKDGWWGQVSHGIFFGGMCAPLSVLEGLDTIFLASSFSENNSREQWGSHPDIDNKIHWANTRIVHDAYELGRQEKIRYILKENPEYLNNLRVCHSQFAKLNCSVCEKCLRTITCLVLEDIDPNQYNFKTDPFIFDLIKIYIDNGFLLVRKSNWENIQDNIPSNLEADKLYNSTQFYEWLRDFNFDEYEYKRDKISLLTKAYYVSRYLGFKYLFKRLYFYASEIQL
jgi:hypothetical protein